MITQEQARRLYHHCNSRGNGFAPDGEFVDAVVDAMVSDGGVVVLHAATTSDVAVVERRDGAIIAIADAHGVWAVRLDENGEQ